MIPTRKKKEDKKNGRFNIVYEFKRFRKEFKQ